MMVYNVTLSLAATCCFFLNIQKQSVAGNVIQLNKKNKHYTKLAKIAGLAANMGKGTPHKELDRLTDRQTLVKTLPSHSM